MKFHNYRVAVWMENKLCKSCAKSLSNANEFLYHAEEYSAACCNIAFLSKTLTFVAIFLVLYS